jgi:hypothetical protein
VEKIANYPDINHCQTVLLQLGAPLSVNIFGELAQANIGHYWMSLECLSMLVLIDSH